MKYYTYTKEEFIDYFRQWEGDLSPNSSWGAWFLLIPSEPTMEIVNNSQDLEWYFEVYKESFYLFFIPENRNEEEELFGIV